MILNPAALLQSRSSEETARTHGRAHTLHLSDTGGLTQIGVHHKTLAPGGRTSDRHWHSRDDEMIYVLTGSVTVVEDDGPHALGPGDSAVWPAGVANAHTVENRSDAPCSFLVIGTRAMDDTCRYPDHGRTLFNDGARWQLVNDADGTVLREGTR